LGGTAENATYLYAIEAPNNVFDSADAFDYCVNSFGCATAGDVSSPLSSANRVVVPAANLGAHLYVLAACQGTPGWQCTTSGADSDGYEAVVRLYAADITLGDPTPPTASGVGGSLAAGGALGGVGDVSFSAADTGSGLYQILFTVDGQAVSRQLLNDSNGPCRNVGPTGDASNAFLYLAPCPQTLSDDRSFDTSLAPNGSHMLSVQLLDAAGNSTTILSRQVTFANSAPSAAIEPCRAAAPGGSVSGTSTSNQAKLTARWSDTAKALRTSHYGAAERVTGRLTATNGAGIAGARIDVCETPSFRGAGTRRIGGGSTGPVGQWSITLPRGVSSGALRFVYSSPQNPALAAASATLRLGVHAGVGLHIAPRTSSVGHRIRFTGRLLGAPIPAGGKQLVLEARSGGEWIQFDNIRTDAHGQYRATYRFKFPGPVTYHFRVLSRYEAAFPYLGGTSRIVTVHER
jgi:hypothetical protein